MSNRHLSRIVAMQALFEWDFMQKDTVDVLSVVENLPEDGASKQLTDTSFADNIVDNVLKKQKDLDSIIEKAAPEWPIDKISTVDRNILRIGLFELLFSDRNEVPAKVAINEAIELAKTFGGDSSGRFVNGVLGAVYKEIGEPGKDETSHKKRKDIPYEEMPLERLGGAVVYAKDGEDYYLALVHDVFGHWTLSKGHIEEDEEQLPGVTRAIKEEIGLDVEVFNELGYNEYVASHPEKGKIRKNVRYYLAKSVFKDLKLKETGGLDDAKWFKLGDILDLNFYDDILPIVTKAVNILLKGEEPETPQP